jgi:hypothetical protein
MRKDSLQYIISCSPIHSIDLITLTILFLFLLKWMVRIEKYLLQWIIHGRESRSKCHYSLLIPVRLLKKIILTFLSWK